MRGVRGHRHRLLAAGHDDVGVAVGDLLHADGDRAQPRAAELVEPQAVFSCRDAGRHGRLAGRVLTLAGGEHLAEDDLVDLARIDPGALSAAVMATLPSSCAGVLAKAPLKEPTGVRAALTITMPVFVRPLALLWLRRVGCPGIRGSAR